MTRALASEWPLKRLESLAERVDYGHTASANSSPVGPQFLRITDIQDDRVDWSTVPYCECEPEALSALELRPGDIVFARTGATTGKSFFLRACPSKAIFASYLIRVRTNLQLVEPAYLARFFQSPAYWTQISKTSVGTAQPGVNASKLRELLVPLPPLEEQRRIAAILDKADDIRRKRREAIALTEQLLRSTFLEMFGDPVSNPKRWPIKFLGELATFTGGGTPSRSVPEYFEGATCWATSKDMKGEVLSDTEEHITDDAIQNSATKLVPPGTILVVVKSKILMHRLPVLVAAVPTCFGQDLKGLSLRDPGLTYYVARHMRIGQDTLLRRARGVNTEGLTLEHLAEYAVMQPPGEMIDRYVSFELATTKAARVSRAATADADHLFNSLVQRAFSGQL